MSDSESEEFTQQPQPRNSPTYRPDDNNHWQNGDIKVDLDKKHYQIEQQLGSGGFAITYLATELDSEQQVVLKLLKDELKKRSDFRVINNSFINEALQLKSCQSSFIVAVDKLTEIDQIQVIIMEYIEGQNLGDKAREMGGKLPVKLALKYIKQVGEALQKVHSQGLLHRDIKPENIMIRASNDEAVLIDFGLALKFDPNNLAANRKWFTPGYAPIEQYQEIVRWGFYTDVYSLAATLYYVLTGEIPTKPENRLSGRELKSPKNLNANIPETVNSAIIEGLKVTHDERPQTIEAWLKLLNKYPNLTNLIDKPFWLLLLSLGILVLTMFLFSKQPICESVFSSVLSSVNICDSNYQSTEYEFRIKHLSNLRIQTSSNNVFQQWELRIYVPNKKEPMMIIIVEELPQLYSLDEYWQDVIKPRIKNSGFNKLIVEEEAQQFKLQNNSGQDEYPALTHNYSYIQDDKLIQRKEVLTVYNSRGYTILFQGDEQEFKKYQEQADKIISSFEFIISE